MLENLTNQELNIRAEHSQTDIVPAATKLYLSKRLALMVLDSISGIATTLGYMRVTSIHNDPTNYSQIVKPKC